jgi:hypothetical protein
MSQVGVLLHRRFLRGHAHLTRQMNTDNIATLGFQEISLVRIDKWI